MLIFITGGCRSGKSTLAVELAGKGRGKVAFVATGLPIDKEMALRIRKHKGQRPKGWKTFEEPHNLSGLLPKLDFDTVIVDCVTVYLTNLLMKKHDADRIEEEMARVVERIKKSRARFIVVSNEVGSGIVPATSLGRKFRDLAGGVNKTLAAAADRVYLTVSGIPVRIK